MSLPQISAELQAKAIKEVNEVPSKIPEYIELVRKWLNEQEHIEARTDGAWILSFLRGCEYDIEATKLRLDRHYTMKTLTPKIFRDRDPFKPEIQELMKEGAVLPLLPLKGSTDPMMLLVRTSLLHHQSMTNLLKYMYMLADICFLEVPNFTISGGMCVIDLGDMDERVYTENIAIWQKMLFFYCTCYPGRHQGMYYINSPPYFSKVFEIMGNLPFVPENANKNLTAFFSENEFYKLREKPGMYNLPRDYDGMNISLKELTDYWKHKLESYKSWFLEDQKFGTNENKRIGKPITAEEFYADIGTRKIVI